MRSKHYQTAEKAAQGIIHDIIDLADTALEDELKQFYCTWEQKADGSYPQKAQSSVQYGEQKADWQKDHHIHNMLR